MFSGRTIYVIAPLHIIILPDRVHSPQIVSTRKFATEPGDVLAQNRIINQLFGLAA